MFWRIEGDRLDTHPGQRVPGPAGPECPFFGRFGYAKLMEQTEKSDGRSDEHRRALLSTDAPPYRPAIFDVDRPSHTAMHWPAACCARRSISLSVNVLSGWSTTTGTSACMPSASRWTSASCRNSLVMMTAVGHPAVSSAMPSCIQHDVHDPQSPIAVSTMSLLAAIVSTSAGSASLEKLSLR
jgi:hypothetical protein